MSDGDVAKTIEALLEERRTFEPPEDFVAEANVAAARRSYDYVREEMPAHA